MNEMRKLMEAVKLDETFDAITIGNARKAGRDAGIKSQLHLFHIDTSELDAYRRWLDGMRGSIELAREFVRGFNEGKREYE